MTKAFRIIFLQIVISHISIITIFAQTPEKNLKKYWYYHYRMLNDFMVKGDCQGCSEIMNEREHKKKDDPVSTPQEIATWGDQTINLGEYIAVLATEYKLLKLNNQPTDTPVGARLCLVTILS